MDRRAISFLALGALVGILLSTIVFIGFLRSERLAQRGEGGGRTVLRLAHALDANHPVHLAMEFMSKRAAELSDGAVEIQIFPSGQLGSEPESIEQLQQGALAMVKTSAAAMEGFVPEMAVFGLPYLFRDNVHYWNVLEGPVGEELLAAGERVGVHGLCYYDSGSRSFYTVGEPIMQPADLRGKKIRVLPSRVAMDLISTLGGAPTPIPWGDLYTALQQGMVDGAENNPPSLLSSRHYEVAKFYALDEHTRIPDVVIFSQSIWLSLAPQVRAWLQQAADESVTYQRELWTQRTAEALEELAAAGVTISRPDKAPFMSASEPILGGFRGTPVGTMARRIREES